MHCFGIGIVPDYSLPVTDVYIATTVHILQKHSHLGVLGAVRPVKTLQLPSWVLDWSPAAEIDQGAIPMSAAVLANYCTSLDTTSEVAFDLVDRRLILRSGFIDDIC